MPYSRPRILIVDHDVDNCEMLPIWLDRNQDVYDITTCYSHREAREMIIKRRFDLYILDYLMPDMTGADFCTTIRQLDPAAPVIVYSAMNLPAVRAECIDRGADLFLLKPDEMERLGPSVEELLEHRLRPVVSRPLHRMRPSSIL